MNSIKDLIYAAAFADSYRIYRVVQKRSPINAWYHADYEANEAKLIYEKMSGQTKEENPEKGGV